MGQDSKLDSLPQRNQTYAPDYIFNFVQVTTFPMVDEEAGVSTPAVPTDTALHDSQHNYPDWTDGEVWAAESLINNMLEYYPDYELQEGLTIRENGRGAYFYGRDHEDTPPDQPLIEVHPSRKFTSLAHELGHDALVESLPWMTGSRLIHSTFKELFADLNSLQFTGLEPENRYLDRDPDKDLEVYQGLEQILDEEHWEEEIMKVDRVLEGLEKENWSQIQDYAKSLAASEPQTGPVLDVRDFPTEGGRKKNYLGKLSDLHGSNHMFYENFFGSKDHSPLADIQEGTRDIWRMAQVLGNTDIMSAEYPVKHAYEDNSQLWGKAVSASYGLDDCSLDEIVPRSADVLKQALETELWDTREQMEEVSQNLDSAGTPEYFVLNSVSGEKYGNKYDTSIDYPHNIGGRLAEQLYKQGVEPMQVIEDPERYVQMSTQAIKQHIKQNI